MKEDRVSKVYQLFEAVEDELSGKDAMIKDLRSKIQYLVDRTECQAFVFPDGTSWKRSPSAYEKDDDFAQMEKNLTSLLNRNKELTDKLQSYIEKDKMSIGYKKC